MAGTGTAHLRPADDALLRVEELVVEFPVAGTVQKVHAVSGISLDVLPGETLGLVGESGCGRAPLGGTVMQLPRPTGGRIIFDGTEVSALRGEKLRRTRPRLQMIFQDPISSLNPRRKIADIVAEGLSIWKIGDDGERRTRVRELLDAVGIDADAAGDRRPHEFSGGQCQRISIARAVATEPRLIICDVPVSALDVSVQAQILNLLEDMKARYGLTLIFIAHDLAVVKNVSDRVAVMYSASSARSAGRTTLREPAHPYTSALLSAIPVPTRRAARAAGPGSAARCPSPLDPPSGCRFRTRWPRARSSARRWSPRCGRCARATSSPATSPRGRAGSPSVARHRRLGGVGRGPAAGPPRADASRPRRGGRGGPYRRHGAEQPDRRPEHRGGEDHPDR